MNLRNSLLQKLKRNCPFEEEINEESPIGELGLDSLALIEVIVELEDEFGFCFEAEDLNLYEWDSVRNMLEAVEKNKNHKKGEK